GAFEYCESLTSISIPSGVTSIEASTFAQSGLTSITIPSSATSIGTYAFYGCLGLTSVTIPSGVTSIGIYAFYGCTNLTSVKLESCKTEIGNKAFDNTAAYTNGNIVTSHSLTRVETQEATCTKAGNSEYFYCSECGGYFSDTAGVVPTSLSAVTIAATGHQNVTHFVANDPTCTEAGNIEYWYCSDCKCYFSDADCTQEITQAETIASALGHTLQHFEAVEAGCDTVGNVEYWYCGDCDTYFSDADATAEITLSQTVVAATGEHEYEVSAIVWNYEDGTATVKCLECGEYHTFDATVTSKNVLGQTTYTITTTINGTEYTDTKTTGTSLMMVQASYSAVTAAIEKANSLNPDDYENFSAVTDAINAVDWSLNVLNQKQVNSYAEAIEEAINNLVLAETVNITEETIEVIDPVEAGETDGE
ncbi:MAG: leucine-rich repeat domain-containing protein, partial [Oscillospiraceae bacterium]|nr:leucine-rich repeat domain-containing protein [Oscillospiraceae bacterium]